MKESRLDDNEKINLVNTTFNSNLDSIVTKLKDVIAKTTLTEDSVTELTTRVDDSINASKVRSAALDTQCKKRSSTN